MAAEIAHHFRQAQPLCGPEPVLKYSLIAGQHANRSQAFADAHRHLLLAEELLPDSSSQQAAEVFEGLSRAKMSIGHTFSAFEYQRRAFDLWVSTGRNQDAVRTASYPIAGSGGKSIEDMTTQALELAEPDSLDKARLLGRWIWLTPGSIEVQSRNFENSIEILGKHDAPGVEMWTRGRWGGLSVAPGHYEHAIEELDRAVALAPLARDPEAETHIHSWAALACGALGRSEELKRHVIAIREAADRSRSAIRQFQSVRASIFASNAFGQFEHLDAMFDRVQQLGVTSSQYAPSVQAITWTEQGRQDQAAVLLSKSWSGVNGRVEADTGLLTEAMASLRFFDITGDSRFVGQARAVLDRSWQPIENLAADRRDRVFDLNRIPPNMFANSGDGGLDSRAQHS